MLCPGSRRASTPDKSVKVEEAIRDRPPFPRHYNPDMYVEFQYGKYLRMLRSPRGTENIPALRTLERHHLTTSWTSALTLRSQDFGMSPVLYSSRCVCSFSCKNRSAVTTAEPNDVNGWQQKRSSNHIRQIKSWISVPMTRTAASW